MCRATPQPDSVPAGLRGFDAGHILSRSSDPVGDAWISPSKLLGDSAGPEFWIAGLIPRRACRASLVQPETGRVVSIVLPALKAAGLKPGRVKFSRRATGVSNHVLCGPGNAKAIEILFLGGGRSSPLIRARSRYCDCAGAARPRFPARDARRSPDDEYRAPDAPRGTSLILDQSWAWRSAADHQV